MRRIFLRVLILGLVACVMRSGRGESFEDVFPEPAPELDIRPAVEIGFTTERRFGYVVQSSTNMTTWTDLPGSIFSGSGELVYRLFRATPGVKTFYRLKRIPVMYPLPNFSCGQTGILMWQPESGVTNVLTFPEPGKFKVLGGDQGTIEQVERDHNTLKFIADAEDRDAYSPYFEGEVYFKFETETNGQYVIKNPELGTLNGSFATVPHDPVEGSPPQVENGFSGQTLYLQYCPDGFELFKFRSSTEVEYRLALGIYNYDPRTGELNVTFAFGWEFRIKLGSVNASVMFRESATVPWRTDHATYRIVTLP